MAIILGTGLMALPMDRLASAGAKASLGSALLAAENALGISISYDRASPSILGSLGLSSLTLSASDSRRILEADRMDAAYNLASVAAALLGKTGVGQALERVTLRNVDIDLDLRRDADLMEKLRQALRAGPAEAAPRGPFEISARRVRMAIRDPEHGAVWTAEVRSLDLILSDREVYVALEGSISGVVNDARLPLRRITVPVSLKGSSTRDFTSARLNLSIAASSDAGVLERQEFLILLRDGMVEARKVRDKAPFDLYARYDTRTGSLEADIRFEALYLSRIGHPAGKREAEWAPWFRRPYTGHVALRYPKIWNAPRLEVDLSGSLPPGFLGDDFTIRVLAKGGLEGVVLETLELRSENGTARMNGTFRPDLASVALTSDIDYAARQGRLPIKSRLSIVGEDRELFLYADSLSVGGVEFKKLAVHADQKPESVDFRGSLDLPGAAVTLEPEKVSVGEEYSGERRVAWEGALIRKPDPFVEATLTLDPYDLDALEPLLAGLMETSTARAISGLSLAGRFSLSSDFSRFSYSAADFRVAPSGKAGGQTFAILNLSGTATNLSASRISASILGYPVEGSLDAEFDESRIGFYTNFRLQDIPYALQGEYDDRRLILTGDYGFSLVATTGETGSRGTVNFRSLPLPLRQGVVLASGEIYAGARSMRDWSLRVSSLELVPDNSLRGRVPVVRLSGSAGPDGGDFPEIAIDDGLSLLRGSARYEGAPSSGDGLRAEVALSGDKGEALRGKGQYERGKIGGRVDLQSFSAARFLGQAIGGNLDGTVAVSGTVSDPKVDFSLALSDGAIKGRSFSASAEGSLDPKGLAIRDGSGRLGIHQAQNLSGSLGFDTGRARIQGAYTGFLAGDVARFRFEAEGDMSAAAYGSSGLPNLSGITNTVKVNGRILDFSMGKNRADRWPFALESHDSELFFRGGENSEVRVQVLDDGSFLARAVPPFPIAALVVGKIADRQIDMDLSEIRIQMTTLWPLIPLPDVRFLSGTATGSLSVRGKVSDPEIFGSLGFENAFLEVPNYLNAPIGPVTAPLNANGRQVTLIQPAVDIGPNAKAGVSLSFELSQWIPRSFSLRARSLESTQVPLKTRFLGMNITGAADADIFLTAEENQLELTGTLTIPRAEIVIDPSIIQGGGARDGAVPRNDTKINLAVRMGKGVTVYFPSKEFPVIIGQADPSSQLTVSYDDSQQTYALKGNAVLRGGNLFYIQRNFFLKSGRMIFNENQYSFDPRVTLEAELRTRRGEEAVKITLRAENASLFNFQPTLESTPSLSQTEIAALLGSELVATDDGADVDIRRTLIASTDILPQLNFINVFERNTRRLLGLDLFYLRTELVQRWLLDVANLDAAAEGGVTLADYLDNTSIFAGKYIRDDIFVRGLVRLQQDQPLVNRSSLRLDSEIGFELTTPFFLFDWNLAFLHPEDLFISDNSFRFTWKLSY